MMVEQTSDYESRDVDYSLIHGETKDVFAKFTRALQLRDNIRLLDLGGGYGSVLVNILENEPQLSFHYDLLDGSIRQIKKAQKHIGEFIKNKNYQATINYIHQNATKLDLPANQYDLVVCKMFIHEIPKHKKDTIFDHLYSVIKPGGVVIFWNPDLTVDNHEFYKETIRKKDELAEFHSLVKNRHFLLNSELIGHLEKAGFTKIEKLFDFNYDLHTSLRLKSEFSNKSEKLKEWHHHISKISQLLDADTRKSLVVEINDENIHIRFKRAIFKAIKA